MDSGAGLHAVVVAAVFATNFEATVLILNVVIIIIIIIMIFFVVTLKLWKLFFLINMCMFFCSNVPFSFSDGHDNNYDGPVGRTLGRRQQDEDATVDNTDRCN